MKEFKERLEIGNPEHIEKVRNYELKRGYNRLTNMESDLKEWEVEFEIVHTFEETITVEAKTEEEALELANDEIHSNCYGYEYEIEQTGITCVDVCEEE